MYLLGINDGHDSGICLLADGQILFAANEERFSRQKYHWGFPYKALDALLESTKIAPEKIDKVVIGAWSMIYNIRTIWDYEQPISWIRRAYEVTTRYMGPLMATDFANQAIKYALWVSRPNRQQTKEFLWQKGIRAPIEYVEHHISHAASAYYTSGFEDCLVVTSDGGGDGISGSVFIAEKGKMLRIAKTPKIHSLGCFWGDITYLCGFNPVSHGGKITGLAAYQEAPEVYQRLRQYYGYSKEKLHPLNKTYLFWRDHVEHLRKVLAGCSIEEIAYAAQKVLEEILVGIIQEGIAKTGKKYVALAGGTFANVRLNQKIFEIPGVEGIFIHPNMGDGGLGVGAALYVSAQNHYLKPYRLDHLYLGPEFPKKEILATCERLGVRYRPLNSVAEFVSDCLVQKKVIGVYHGRMEYGPRALGHRSILAEPTDPTMMDWLNKRLDRTEFMPFAPIVIEEEAPKYFHNFPKAAYPTRFMTLCLDSTPLAKEKAPGIVHRDGTARPQSVSRQSEPYIYEILRAYQRKTGLPICINTSFNRHDEPIVCYPEDAIQEFLRGGVDVLVMEDLEIIPLRFAQSRSE